MKTFKIVSLSLLLLGGAAVLVSMIQKQNEGVKLNATEMSVPYEVQDFKLNYVDGSPFTRESLMGRYTLLYFGFTRCPDACPTTLAHWKSEIAKLDAKAKSEIQFLLVSVDPEHDNAELLAKYVSGFDASIKAATGEQKELHRLADSMKTTFHKEEENAGHPDLYMMAHSPRYFLINPKGQLQAVYNPPLESGVLAGDLNRLIEKASGKFF